MRNRHNCAKTGTTLKHKRHLQLFFAMGPLHYDAMNIMGPLSKTTKGSQHAVISSSRYSKLKRAVPTTKITAKAAVCIFWAYHATCPQALQTQLLARIKALHARVNKRLDLAQKRYIHNYDTKFCSSPTSIPGQMFYIGKPLLAGFFPQQRW